MAQKRIGLSVSRRTAIRGLGITAGTVVTGGAGLWYTSQGASAQVASNTLTSDGAVQITSDGGDVTDLALTSTTKFDLGWEGFDGDIDSVEFILEAKRSDVGTGSDESTARNTLGTDSGSVSTTIFTDTPTVLSPGRNGTAEYISSDLATSFPFAIISSGVQGTSVSGTIADANIDAASLSLSDDGNVKVNVIEFTLTANVAAGTQQVTTTETGTLDVVVENMASTADTGGSIGGSGSGE